MILTQVAIDLFQFRQPIDALYDIVKILCHEEMNQRGIISVILGFSLQFEA